MGGRRIRVAWLSGPVPLESGHLTLLAEQVDLMLVASEGPGKGISSPGVEGVPVADVRALGARNTHIRWIYPALGRRLRAFRPDVVHVVVEPWGLLAVQAALWVRRHPDTRLVLHGCDRIWWHGGRLEQLAKRVLARVSLRVASGFAAETSAVAPLARSAGLAVGAPTAQIHTQPRDPEQFRPPTAEERAAGRSELGLPAHGPGVAFVGRMVPEKGPLVLLEAWRRLAPEVRQDAWLALAGTGPLDELVAHTSEGCGGVHVLGAVPFPDGILALSRAAQIAVVPSYTVPDWDDQSPRAVIEGLLSGAVVVGSASGGIPVMLEDTGILVREHDPEDLARGLAEALAVVRDPAQAAEATAQAVARGTAAYSVDCVAEQLHELWSRCLAVRT